jgi:hypothetical protein
MYSKAATERIYMTGLKILALTPFCGAGIIAAVEPVTQSPYVEYGALGLCAVVVMFLCNYLKSLTAQHREERAELVQGLQTKDGELAKLTQQNTEAYNRLSQLLRDRPCLMKDSRIGQD